jgi:hypothetical protein
MIRRLLETRKLRERVLLVAFVWAIVALWAVVSIGAFRRHLSAMRIARAEVKNQNVVMAERAEIEQRLDKARTMIDPAKTIGPLKLSSTVDSIARDAGLEATIASPTSKTSDIFNRNTVKVSCKKTSIDQLVAFAQAVRKQSPYLTISRFKISADSHDPHLLGAEFEIESLELSKPISK